MAKRPTRSKADEVATEPAAPKTQSPVKGVRELGPDAIGPAAISGREPDQEKIQQAPGDAIAARAGAMRPSGPTDEEIRARAYQMYLERGGEHGMDFDDWMRAERELKNRG
jgi:DUF2934 family protein